MTTDNMTYAERFALETDGLDLRYRCDRVTGCASLRVPYAQVYVTPALLAAGKVLVSAGVTDGGGTILRPTRVPIGEAAERLIKAVRAGDTRGWANSADNDVAAMVRRLTDPSISYWSRVDRYSGEGWVDLIRRHAGPAID